jgi:hypothetical protein
MRWQARLSRYRLWLLLLAAAITVTLTIVLRDFVRENIVVPAAYILWTINLYLRTVPQALVWGLFLALVIFLGFQALLPPLPQRSQRREDRLAYQAPIQRELRFVRLALKGSYGRWRLAQRVRELALAALAQRDRISEDKVEQRLRLSPGYVPVDVAAYLETAARPIGVWADGFLRWARGRGAPEIPSSLSREEADRVIHFIEKELESAHGI